MTTNDSVCLWVVVFTMSGREPEHQIAVPIIQQSWRRVTWLYWPIDPEAIARSLPAELEPDLIAGQAWIAVTPFEVRRFGVVGLPTVPRLSSFSETNVRTYVRHRNGSDGLWFFSLDVDSTLNVLGGRVIGLPYFRSTMSVDGDDTIRYRCRRLGRDGHHDITVRPGPPVTPDATIDRLTGRWRAYTTIGNHTFEIPVSHQPWPLQTAEIVALDESLISAAGLPTPTGAPLAHWSAGVDAIFGRVRTGWPYRGLRERPSRRSPT